MGSAPHSRGLQKGDSVPFFEVDTLDRGRARYADLWQRMNVVVVCLPSSASPDETAYINELARRAGEFEAYSAVCVVTRDKIGGLQPPAALIADRWGEIQHLASSAGVSDLPPPQDLLDTLDYVQRRCPECEGEWR